MGPWTLIVVFQGVIGPSRALTTVTIPGFSLEETALKEGDKMRQGNVESSKEVTVAYYYAVEVK